MGGDGGEFTSSSLCFYINIFYQWKRPPLFKDSHRLQFITFLYCISSLFFLLYLFNLKLIFHMLITLKEYTKQFISHWPRKPCAPHMFYVHTGAHVPTARQPHWHLCSSPTTILRVFLLTSARAGLPPGLDPSTSFMVRLEQLFFHTVFHVQNEILLGFWLEGYQTYWRIWGRFSLFSILILCLTLVCWPGVKPGLHWCTPSVEMPSRNH